VWREENHPSQLQQPPVPFLRQAELLRSLADCLKEDGQIFLQLYGESSVPVRWKFYTTIDKQSAELWLKQDWKLQI